ncbi:MAG TPA: GNAT family N-acetyltransferase [Bryobacteraceae bacterium]|nr:GNAT family N-acetyltransferase [Bryobacteraceae bacterium]
MNVEFRRADPATELRSLVIFDRKVFSATDAFPADMWSEIEPWWMLVDGVKAGCCAFERNLNFDRHGEPFAQKGSLYIATTGILPRFQGKGLGRLMKSWQVAFARHHHFSRIVTNHRASNHAIISLNRSFGFKQVRKIPGYYLEPEEPAISMELVLTRRSSKD